MDLNKPDGLNMVVPCLELMRSVYTCESRDRDANDDIFTFGLQLVLCRGQHPSHGHVVDDIRNEIYHILTPEQTCEDNAERYSGQKNSMVISTSSFNHLTNYSYSRMVAIEGPNLT